MSPRLAIALYFTILIFFSPATLTCEDAPQQQQLDSFLATAKQANLRAVGSPPFHLRLQLHAEHITLKPIDGTFDELWNGPDQWRREITFPEFRQVEIGDKNGRWLDRNIAYRPQPAYLVSVLLDALMSPMHSANGRLRKMHKVKQDGAQLQCAAIEDNQSEYALCFDEQGRLAASGYRNLVFEYRHYEKFGDKQFPREISVVQDHKQVLQVRLDELTSMAAPDASGFPHASSSLRLSRCERWEPGIPVKKVPPHYPENARMMHQQGTVVFYALLLPEGVVHDVKTLQSAGAALDQAATATFTQWVYAPIDCPGSQFPTEIQVSINFELR